MVLGSPMLEPAWRRWRAMRATGFLGSALALALLAGCAAESGDLRTRKVRIVVTTGMIADIATNVGGARVAVTALMGAGVDPHLYRASERDVIRLAEADVVFFNGLHLEGRMGKVFERMRGRVRAVAVTERIPADRLLGEDDAPDVHDPHVWFDVGLWMVAVGTV